MIPEPYADGLDTAIDAAVYRIGYDGPIIRPDEGKPRRTARDTARQLAEWAKTGDILVVNKLCDIVYPVMDDDVQPDVVIDE